MDAKIKIEKDGKIHETNTSLFKPYPSKEDDYLRRFNMQWRFGASLNFKQYMIGVNMDGDMTNLLRVSNYNKQFYEGSLNTWEMFLTLGYNFK